MYYFEAATDAHVEAIAPNLRTADKEECLAGGFKDPVDCLKQSIRVPGYHFAMYSDGEIAMMSGISDQGVIWAMTTSKLIEENVKDFHESTSELLKFYGQYQGLLHNFIYSANIVHIEWLRRVGFIITNHTQTAPSTGASFIYFYKEINNV